ncbi:hypothetical protein [Simkania sp.]|uniref:hypothetical protein n=1 Tax=Simkania sp. TaxID=34094 RepID=UPI003B517CAA
MTKIQANLFPANYAMDAFGSKDLSNTQKGLTLALTITATYLSYTYLPPSMNKWVGGITVLTGGAFFLFGGLEKLLEYVSGLFNNPSKSGTANMWGGGDDPTPQNTLNPGFKTSGTRPVKKGSGHPKPNAGSTTPSHIPSHGVTVNTDQGKATVHVGSKTSGERPVKKDKP